MPVSANGAAWACRSLTIATGLGDAQDIVRFFVSGVIYSALVGGAVLAVPQLVGLTRQDLRGLATRALGRFRKSGGSAAFTQHRHIAPRIVRGYTATA